ncbi:C-type lectin domain-containing protein [Meloidogyne graminicola]|uniref:C-type lectin domain-containing protein n=1 Tax=Meloidogyne graminicola TaxID=189291 RepID=A0A8S9ZK04_9BILA|nr:C-type lectin domain-containing protein [Meloidogyne graminicola]
MKLIKINYLFILQLFLLYLTTAYFTYNNNNNNNCPNIYCIPCYIENKLLFYENKIQTILTRIEALERVLMNEWNITEYGNIYKIFNDSKNWEEANNICIKFNARLAIIDSDYKNAFVRNMIENNFGNNSNNVEVWIGLKTKSELTKLIQIHILIILMKMKKLMVVL